MTSNVTVSRSGTTAPAATLVRGRTRLLLTGGAVAGPLFIVVGVTHALTRTGFDPVKHPISMLSLGDLGWLQITNFVLAGLLFLASALGMRRVLHPGRAGTWGPRLFGVFGVALIGGGVLVADPGLGFPPGTPDGMPEETSWHGFAHSMAPVAAFLALTIACFVFARRSFGLGERGWAVFSVVTGIAIQALGAVSSSTLNFIPLWVGLVLGFGWASAQAARLMTAPPRS